MKRFGSLAAALGFFATLLGGAVPASSREDSSLGSAYARLQGEARSSLGAVHVSARNAAPFVLRASGALVPIVIYHTNDIHGAIEPYRAQNGRAWGGAPSLATALKKEANPYMWIDSGDWFQGTPIGNLSRGEAVMAIFNALNLTTTVLGNHDFDYGKGVVQSLIQAAHFPVLGANVVSRGTGRTLSYVTPYLLKDVSGVKVGIFGLLTDDMKNLESAGNTRGLEFASLVRTGQRAVAELRRQGAQVVIAVTHAGIESYDGHQFTAVGTGDEALAAKVPGIDLILGGHTHTFIDPPLVENAGGRRTFIVQSGHALMALHRLVLYVDPLSGRIDHLGSRLLWLNPRSFPPDPAIAKLVDDYAKKTEAGMDSIVGRSQQTLSNQGVYAEGSMGDWVADAMRRFAGTDLGMVNVFGMRGGIREGDVTYKELYDAMPFDNTAAKAAVYGRDLKTVIDRALAEGPGMLEYSGLHLVCDPSAPSGQRIKSLTIGGAPVEDAKVYTVAAADFVLLDSRYFKDVPLVGRVQKSHDLVRDILASDLKANSPLPIPEGNRVVVQSAAQ